MSGFEGAGFRQRSPATRRRPLQEGQSADVVHEVHQADLRLGSDETDRAHDLPTHAGVLMAEDVLDARAPWTALCSPLAPAAIGAFLGSPGGGCGFASPSRRASPRSP